MTVEFRPVPGRPVVEVHGWIDHEEEILEIARQLDVPVTEFDRYVDEHDHTIYPARTVRGVMLHVLLGGANQWTGDVVYVTVGTYVHFYARHKVREEVQDAQA
jgi:hypothetical protein